MREYAGEICGKTAWALIRNPDGTVREATPEELERLRKMYEPDLKSSFTVEQQ